MGFSIFNYARGSQSQDWPSVQGEIVSSGVRNSSNGEGGKKSSLPEIEYRYAYKPGTAVTVYYKPNDPAVAVLRNGTSKGAFFGILMGLAFAGIGRLAIWWVDFLERRKGREAAEKG